MRRYFRDSSVAIVVRPEAGAPSQLVDYAEVVRQRDPDGFDEVWCVFDVDEFDDDIKTATENARRAEISLAISNPCFEFWLLLHFKEHTAWLNGAGAAKSALCRYLAAYDKSKLDFTVFAPGIADAIDRGRRLTESGSTNPSTTMWRLAATVTSR
jgi:hypothetical protein